MSKNIILTHQEIEYKIKRIAFQIYETFIDQTEIVIIGIHGNGSIFAQKIADTIVAISPLQVVFGEVYIDKKNPTMPITTTITPLQYKNKGIILVDDVLNSGTTLIYGVKHFLDFPVQKFKTAVLVDRNHKKYPVKADFKGISLSTSSLENVTVVFEPNNSFVFLE